MLKLKRPPLCTYVIEMYDWFNEPGYISIVMEYPKPCEALRDCIRNRGKLEEPVACRLVRQIVLAVKHCFDNGIVHNDLHPGNILVNTETWQIKLIDFGCAFKVLALNYHRAVLSSAWDIGYLLYFMVTGGMLNFGVAKSKPCTLHEPSLTSECSDLIEKCLNECMTLDEFLQHDWMKLHLDEDST
nr:serine/threonine-protein kinase pim-2 [Danio rerio]|eukprot:XP_009294799.1 serine/threonine-protein kinase pim-2 [Danio rerio]